MITAINQANSANINFKAKFFYTEDLCNVAKYAVENGKFEKLNQSRKNIDSSYLTTRLQLHIGTNKEGFPVVSFTRILPKKGVIIPQAAKDYEVKKVTEFVSSKKMNPLKFAYEKLIKLGNNAPKNKMYQEVVINK